MMEFEKQFQTEFCCSTSIAQRYLEIVKWFSTYEFFTENCAEICRC